MASLVDLFAHGGEMVGEQVGGGEGVSGDGVDGGVGDGVGRYLQVTGVWRARMAALLKVAL